MIYLQDRVSERERERERKSIFVEGGRKNRKERVFSIEIVQTIML